MLGVPEVGIELDAAACATRRAAGHHVIRADVAKFPVEQLAGRVWGQCDSPPCTTFSAAGDGAGNLITAILAAGIQDAMAGRKTRAQRRREMAHALQVSKWGGDRPGRPCHEFPGADWKWTRKEQDGWKRKLRSRRGSPAALRRDMAAAGDGRHPTRVQRSAKIQAAVRSAALVIEPARLHPRLPAGMGRARAGPLGAAPVAGVRGRTRASWATPPGAGSSTPRTTGSRRPGCAPSSSPPGSARSSRPEPTHYDPRKGMQLWGTPWVSMAEALGWGATGRPGPAVTAGGTSTGGAEPFAPRRPGRAGGGAGRRGTGSCTPTGTSGRTAARQTADPRSAPAPALTAKSGGQWVLHRSRGKGTAASAKDGAAAA